MVIISYRPYTPSRRFMTRVSTSDITSSSPEKSLTVGMKNNSWRNNQWRVTSRFRWWWNKRLYRMIDFRGYDKLDIPARVVSIEYDPNRTSRIALLFYADGEKRYVLAWKWCSVWDVVQNWSLSPIVNGNRKQLKDIPEWVSIYNIELVPFTKWKLIKSAWMSASLWWWTSQNYRVIKLPSGEVRKFHENCWATIWQVSHEEHRNIVIGKAWRKRWVWKKPHVLWKSMNAVDHPHGWWEWHTSLGMKSPKTRTGRKVAPGMKTRRKKNPSQTFIISRRKKK